MPQDNRDVVEKLLSNKVLIKTLSCRLHICSMPYTFPLRPACFFSLNKLFKLFYQAKALIEQISFGFISLFHNNHKSLPFEYHAHIWRIHVHTTVQYEGTLQYKKHFHEHIDKIRMFQTGKLDKESRYNLTTDWFTYSPGMEKVQLRSGHAVYFV